MYPITFWLRKVFIGNREFQSNSLFRCDIFQEHLEIYNKDERILKFLLRYVIKVKIYDVIGNAHYSRTAYVEIDLGDRNEKITIETINPIYPRVLSYVNFGESRKFKKAIKDLTKHKHTPIQPNPYIRNEKSVKPLINFERLDVNLYPEEFFDKYLKRIVKINLILAIFVFPSIMGVLFWIIMEILFP